MLLADLFTSITSLGSIHPHTCFNAPWVIQVQLTSLSIARYSGPSFSGHSTEATLSNVAIHFWPYYYEFVIYLSLSSSMSKGTSLMWPQFLGKEGDLKRGGLLYSFTSEWTEAPLLSPIAHARQFMMSQLAFAGLEPQILWLRGRCDNHWAIALPKACTLYISCKGGELGHVTTKH